MWVYRGEGLDGEWDLKLGEDWVEGWARMWEMQRGVLLVEESVPGMVGEKAGRWVSGKVQGRELWLVHSRG